MKPSILITTALVLCFSLNAGAQDKKPAPTLRSILLEQLHSTHDKSDWFVCANVAVAHLTPEQARWTDGKGNHSVGQLTYHLLFWNKEELAKFKGEPAVKYSGKNDDTFNNYDPKKWNETVKQLDQVLTDWENAIEAAPDAKLSEWASGI